MYNNKLRELTDEEKKLIEDNVGFMIYWFNKYDVHDEDVQQDLFFNLCIRIHLFDPKKGSIATFISRINENRLVTLYNYEHRLKRVLDKVNVSLDDVICDLNDGDLLTYADVIGTYSDGFKEIENEQLIKQISEKLSTDCKIKERDIKIFITYLNNGNYSDVGKMFGITRERVRQIFNKIIRTIKKKKWIE